jgi:serine protease Do
LGEVEMLRRTLVSAGIIILLVLSLSLFACGQQSSTQDDTSSQQDQQLELPTITEVVASVRPSVVAVNVEVVTYDIFNRPITEEGAGSGWIVREDGYIVTNNHVVSGADKVTVTLEDGTSYSAESVRTDALTDLAVLKIQANNLPALKIGDSSKLEVGDWVVAIGNALGQGISATNGIVSALDVSLEVSPGQTIHNLIQTDAAINPGNSGGPLVNMAGEVVGIDSIKIAEVGVEGMGYAYSINDAMPIIDELISTGYIARPWMGIGVSTIDSLVASFYNLAVDQGVLVTSVVTDSPADKAGIQDGDAITMIDGKEVTSVDDLQSLINSYQAGQEISITYWRGDTKETTSLTLVESPPPQY